LDLAQTGSFEQVLGRKIERQIKSTQGNKSLRKNQNNLPATMKRRDATGLPPLSRAAEKELSRDEVEHGRNLQN
jgi:hypothetical protein